MPVFLKYKDNVKTCIYTIHALYQNINLNVSKKKYKIIFSLSSLIIYSHGIVFPTVNHLPMTVAMILIINRHLFQQLKCKYHINNNTSWNLKWYKCTKLVSLIVWFVTRIIGLSWPVMWWQKCTPKHDKSPYFSQLLCN